MDFLNVCFVWIKFLDRWLSQVKRDLAVLKHEASMQAQRTLIFAAEEAISSESLSDTTITHGIMSSLFKKPFYKYSVFIHKKSHFYQIICKQFFGFFKIIIKKKKLSVVIVHRQISIQMSGPTITLQIILSFKIRLDYLVYMKHRIILCL